MALGTLCQVLLLPLIGLLITLLVPMQPEIAAGLMILAICPGDPSLNLITYLARGDEALSVTPTAFSSSSTGFTIPLFANLALQHALGEATSITLPITKWALAYLGQGSCHCLA